MPQAADDGSARTFDWRGAYERLSQAHAAIEAAQHPPAEIVQRVLRKRAAAIAAPQRKAAGAATVSLVAFLAGERAFAVDVDQVDQVVTIGDLTPVPGLPSLYLGLIHHRGAVYPVVDINALFDTAAGEAGEPHHAILVSDAEQAIAIGARTVTGLLRIDPSAITPVDPETARHPAIRGFTPDRATVFGARQLVRDARLIVNDQPRAESGTGAHRPEPGHSRGASAPSDREGD